MVTSHAVNTFIKNNIQQYYDSDADRGNETARKNAIMYVLNNYPSNIFTIRYTGGFYHLYISNAIGVVTNAEITVIEISPYGTGSGGHIWIYHANLRNNEILLNASL